MEEGKDFEDLDERELNELGNAYSSQGMWEEAIGSYLRSLALRKAQGDIRGQGIVLNNLGAVYYNQRRYQEARECYEGSRQIAHELEEELSELVALMNLAFLQFTEGQTEEFLRYADEAEDLALDLERWEPLSKLSWLKGRLAMSDSEAYEEGLARYADALRYAAREGEDDLSAMMDRVDAQAERLLLEGARGMALVLYDYLQAFMEEQGFSEELLAHLGNKREEILQRPSLA
ncbi:MAG: tetratricopeptide repeat protein [Anaerolineae bacterium]|nr:tetratricopeptide repeat protein [Anaerolineae bacterium]NIN93406.1 tetratricopeptide repeat protein [Anaerolineae bacterium]NIQ76514.1 tetratricopeptide repeat protein [Anaerolineae bacterium]